MTSVATGTAAMLFMLLIKIELKTRKFFMVTFVVGGYSYHLSPPVLKASDVPDSQF